MTRASLWSGFGLAIRSAIDLPGAVRADDEAAPADIEIVPGAAPDWHPVRTWEVYRVASADLFDIAMPGVARFTCLDRRRILVDPAPGVDAATLGARIVATVLPALLWARGEIVLHAAAFVLPDATQAIAVCGRSGSGKSLALARALALGGRAIADDSIRVAVAHGATTVAGLAGGYFERQGATRTFRTTAAPAHAGTLGALLVLTPDAAAPRRLAGPAALAALLRQRHRHRIATLLGTEPALLPALATLVRSVPIIEMPTDPMGDNA